MLKDKKLPGSTRTKLMVGVSSLAAVGLGVGMLATVVTTGLADSAQAATTSVNASVPMTCNFGIAGSGYTTSATVTGTATDPVVVGGNVAVDATASIAMPASLVADLVNDLGATAVTINSISVGVKASGDVVQSSQTASVESINGASLPDTIPVADLTSSIPGVLAETDWTAGSSPGTISYTAGDTVFAVTVILASGSIPDQGGTCVPNSTVSLGSVTVNSVGGTSTTTTSTTSCPGFVGADGQYYCGTSEPPPMSTTTTTTSTTGAFNICKYVPFFLRWLFAFFLHCKY